MNTENHSETKKDPEDRQLHTMAKVHNFLGMWQCRRNLLATMKQSRRENNTMTAMGYISDTQEIVKACWVLLFHQDGAAAFKMSERYCLPPPLSAKNLPGV
jgi:hypothetical protein